MKTWRETKEGREAEPRAKSLEWQNPAIRRIGIFILLYALWLILSGTFYPEFLFAGAIASALVAYMTDHLTAPSRAEHYEPLPRDLAWLFATLFRFITYLPWLTKEIAIANLQVTYQILHPKLPIEPRLVRLHTSLRREPSQLLLAQSITLTPGTITVDLGHNDLLIHALSGPTMEAIQEGRMQQRIADVFGEGTLESTPQIRPIEDISELSRW